MLLRFIPRSKGDRTWGDGYSGLGGSSHGIRQAGGEVVYGVNHWDIAIRNFQLGHPDAEAYQCDMTVALPWWFPTTEYAWFSPVCQGNSRANTKRGKAEHIYQLLLFEQKVIDPSVQRSRVTAWEVLGMVTWHRYRAFIVENVPPFSDGKVFPEYEEWLGEIKKLGYETRELYLNGQFFDVPQNRDRYYLVAWDPKRMSRAPNLDFTVRGFCPKCGHDVDGVQHWKAGRSRGVYGVDRGQYFYRCPHHGKWDVVPIEPHTLPAASIIDLSLPVPIIGERAALGLSELKPKTLARIRKGLRKFGMRALAIDLAHLHGQSVMAKPLDEPLPTQTTAQTQGMVVPPLVINTGHAEGHNGRSGGLKAWPSSRPLPTQTARAELAWAFPPAGSFLTYLKGTGTARDIQEPAPTITAGGNHLALTVPPFIAPYNGQANAVEVSRPLPTVTTVERHGLVVPPSGSLAELSDHELEAWVLACGFRMLEPASEIAAAMDLADYPLLNVSKRNQTKLLGNAVLPKKAKRLAAEVMAAAEGAPVA